MDVLIPPLTLQPLVENAIYHGIEPIVDGGIINIEFHRVNDDLIISISNPIFQHSEKRQGNQMALNNIKERLNIAFKGQSTFNLKQTDTLFSVTISLPMSQR